MTKIEKMGDEQKVTTPEMELAVVNYLNYRTNLIVPNISWGMFLHECDLLVITKSNCAWEIEIKISKADLVKDKKKRHGHRSSKIRLLYFAIPEYLLDYQNYIPERAGILVVKHHSNKAFGMHCRQVRKSKINSNYRFTDQERYNVARLGAMRIWGLKRKVVKLQLKERDDGKK